MFDFLKIKKYFEMGNVYLLQGSSFPDPLTESEERYYLGKMHKGDEEAKNILIEHNLRLVAHIVKKYPSAGENDDLISIGTIGLIKGISSYDAKKKTKLATYVARCIEKTIPSQRLLLKQKREYLLPFVVK